VPVPLAAAVVQPGFPGGGEPGGQFGNKPVEVVAGDAGEHRMGQGHTGRFDRHKSATVRPAAVSIKPTRGVTSTPRY
jgi:hypothetical protein